MFSRRFPDNSFFSGHLGRIQTYQVSQLSFYKEYFPSALLQPVLFSQRAFSKRVLLSQDLQSFPSALFQSVLLCLRICNPFLAHFFKACSSTLGFAILSQRAFSKRALVSQDLQSFLWQILLLDCIFELDEEKNKSAQVEKTRQWDIIIFCYFDHRSFLALHVFCFALVVRIYKLLATSSHSIFWVLPQ